jgi:peptidyl-prolyl cis-trans isomerase C
MLLVFACALAGASMAQDDAEPITLVEVDGFAVTNLHLALFATQTGRNPQEPEGQVKLLNELINNFMIANSSQGKELAGQAEVAAALDVARARLIAQTFIRSQLQQTSIDESAVQELYAARYGDQKLVEYKARHILSSSEADAQAVIAELDGGADFATLAAQRSIGPSKSVGGDLGWFEAGQMVGEFSAATAQLADGSYSKTPVQTQFGWHVILREQSREAAPPSVDSVRPELEKQLQQQQVAKSIAAIREAAQIKVQPLEDAN